ncbi:hypothetical protein [Natranaerofaba carboxydovora]|uniref:hypothetical protein n=1 Tax=Natranaerofaba carboxydovora TaxID=2742683 RepID=UPI001F13FF9E|nr:hypothetical protein [Natranaerofaba carboxydovora]UMZ73021.1 hypothetical protein ACONDI_00565 [Natranaerofaba carboxydovora]
MCGSDKKSINNFLYDFLNLPLVLSTTLEEFSENDSKKKVYFERNWSYGYNRSGEKLNLTFYYTDKKRIKLLEIPLEKISNIEKIKSKNEANGFKIILKDKEKYYAKTADNCYVCSEVRFYEHRLYNSRVIREIDEKLNELKGFEIVLKIKDKVFETIDANKYGEEWFYLWGIDYDFGVNFSIFHPKTDDHEHIELENLQKHEILDDGVKLSFKDREVIIKSY